MESTANAAVMPSAAPVVTVNRHTWVRRIIGGGQVIEACPAWCTADHRADLLSNLDDLIHHGPEVAVEIPVVEHWEDGEPVTYQAPALIARLHVDPYSTNPRRNRPFATLEVMEDVTADELGPDDLAAIIEQFRAHVNRLVAVHTQLVAAVAEHGAGGAQ